jgi:hypothetical protein
MNVQVSATKISIRLCPHEYVYVMLPSDFSILTISTNLWQVGQRTLMVGFQANIN